MSERTEREIRAIKAEIDEMQIAMARQVRLKRAEVYADFLDTARRMPFKHRWTLAWNILRGQRKLRKVDE